jgi:hypothetical protein
MVYIVALFNKEDTPLYFSSALLLSLAVTAKFALTRVIIFQNNNHYFQYKTHANLIIGLTSFLLLIVFSLPINSYSYYLGQIPPNVWHNSTIIFVMPFALALFWISYSQLNKPTRSRIVFILILCILNILIKPSFFFVFAVVCPLMLIKRFGFREDMWKNLFPVIFGTIVVVEYLLIYKYSISYGNASVMESGIALRPFSVWSHFSSNIILSLFVSLTFPITYLIFYWRDLKESLLLQYSIGLYLVAVSMSILLSETGPREFHSNFFRRA